jgi:hypothetical protein
MCGRRRRYCYIVLRPYKISGQRMRWSGSVCVGRMNVVHSFGWLSGTRSRWVGSTMGGLTDIRQNAAPSPSGVALSEAPMVSTVLDHLSGIRIEEPLVIVISGALWVFVTMARYSGIRQEEAPSGDLPPDKGSGLPYGKVGVPMGGHWFWFAFLTIGGCLR